MVLEIPDRVCYNIKSVQTHYRFKQTLKYQAAEYGCVVVGVTEE